MMQTREFTNAELADMVERMAPYWATSYSTDAGLIAECVKRLRAAAKAHPEAAQAEPSPSPDSTQVPTGHKLVPRKPTAEMVAAFKLHYQQGSIWTDRLTRAIEAMLEAVPAQSAPVGVAQPVGSALTDEQIERHKLRAGDCPPNSEVLLVSGVKRLQAKNLSTPPAERAQGEPVALSMSMFATSADYHAAIAAHPQGANEPAEDAARYQWLRTRDVTFETEDGPLFVSYIPEYGVKLDANIDAAMEAERKSAAGEKP